MERAVLARRDVLKGMACATLAGLPLAVGLSGADRARAGALHRYTIYTPEGRRVGGYVAFPNGLPAPTVVVIHDRRGLNEWIGSVTAELGRQGYLALAVDLMEGRVAASPEEGVTLQASVDPAAARDTLTGWIEWLRVHDGSNRRIGMVGWGFGGGWALNASVAAPVEATVLYYGRPSPEVDGLSKLKGPVLAHFATRDRVVDGAVVARWERAMDEVDKAYTTRWYDADHGFADPADTRYDEADARLAWARTLAFFDAQL